MEITIFTPTYNRINILWKAYESLIKQTKKDFIWLIVDDGSTDKTEEVVQKWKNEKKIEIHYIKQKNSGKHVAHNTAVKNCKTDFMLILDSDDYLSTNAIEILEKECAIISEMENISGIIGNRYDSKSKSVIGTKLPENIKYASGIELYQRYKFRGDTLRLYKTKILKKYLFPVIKEEKFIYENVVFDKIDKYYKMLVDRNEMYYGEYLEDGYTNNSIKIQMENPKGFLMSINSNAKYAITLKAKITSAVLYNIWRMVLKDDQKSEKVEESFYNKYMEYITLPIAKILYKAKIPKKLFNKIDKFKADNYKKLR